MAEQILPYIEHDVAHIRHKSNTTIRETEIGALRFPIVTKDLRRDNSERRQ
ncbi:MAG: hypothetical protein HY966_02025 [Ignavibacteriales bacterium]|nr:hypothetical protein [Ignavibacteriales bacterium]